MSRRAITVDDAISVLNEAIEADRDAVSRLLRQRVPCNQAMADHPTIQVGPRGDVGEGGAGFEVGLLGILNGIFGADAYGWGFIAVELDDVDETLTRFVRTPPREASEACDQEVFEREPYVCPGCRHEDTVGCAYCDVRLGR